MTPRFFATKKELRKWFQLHHDKETELWVGYYKTATGTPSVSWPESVDEALCYGWIDAVRKSIDDTSYMIRFTKRKPTSIWSAINIAKAESLISQGFMHPPGLAAFEKRREHKSKIYSYESEPKKLTAPFEKQFKANKAAWAFFTGQPPWYQKTAIHLVMSAKQEATRIKRLSALIADCEAGRKIKALSYTNKKKEDPQ